MEQKKLKKLVLNKETISTLNEVGMNQLKGGAITPDNTSVYVNLSCIIKTYTVKNPNDYQNNATKVASVCGTCAGGTGYGMCCNNATLYCTPY